MTPSRPPLSGLRIVEFSAFVAAPSAGLALAQLGADVIRIDPPGGNIDAQRLPLNAEGASLYWAQLNHGKRSVEIDPRAPRGRALMQDLIAAPGESGGIFLTNLGVDGDLGYDALAAKRPDLIMVQLSGSPDGTNALDYTVNCAAGYPMATGDGRAPVNHVLPAWDLIAGMTIATAILAADRHRRLTGEGQLVRLTLADLAFAATANLGYLADVEVNGHVRAADGNLLYGAYGDAFRTADGRWAMVVAISDRQWRSLVGAMGLGDAIAAAAAALGHRLDSEAGRWAARELISACLRPWFAARTLAEVGAALSSDRGVLWGPYRDFGQMLAEDPRVSEANPMFARLEHPGYGRFLTAASPISFSRSSRPPPGIAPRLGEHTDEVLASVLGLSVEAIDALRRDGVAGRRPAA
ncbi:MAG TPA: CoA transferase [Burkholderiaceae bacterium]|nr:CoA transferase [Burkholderiaceae bacterium]